MLAKFPEKDIENRFTQAAKQSLALAQEESRLIGHKVIGTEQILLGLIAEGTGLAAQVLKSRGVYLKNARSEVERILGGGSAVGEKEIPFSPTAKESLKLSKEATLELGHRDIDTGHLLLGLIHQGRQGEGVAVWILRNLKVDLEKLEQQILEHLRDSEPAKPSRISWSADGANLTSYRPLDLVSSQIAASFIAWLVPRIEAYNLGCVLSSNSGFKLPNGDVLALGICFISTARLKHSQRTYIEVPPELVVEIKSSGEQLISLQANIQQLIDLGTQVGVLIDPDERTVIIYRASGEVTVLSDGDTLTIPELLPAWKLAISSLWPPELA
jgi:Uma2 family endonuclease